MCKKREILHARGISLCSVYMPSCGCDPSRKTYGSPLSFGCVVPSHVLNRFSFSTLLVNKRQKRLENKFLTTLTEIQELKNHCEQKDNEKNDWQESLEDKQRVIDDNLDTIDSSNQAISQLKSKKT